MSDFLTRIERLSPEKRELLKILMQEEATGVQQNYVAPRTSTEQVLATIWSQVLGIEQIGIHDNFLELGGDSILSIQVVAKANQAGLKVSTNQLFEYPTIAELVTVIGTSSTIQAEQEPVVGAVPLTPIQHWFFEQNFPEPHHWNQAILLEVEPEANPSKLEEVFQQLLVHHDALRLRFEQKEGSWQQYNGSPEEKVCFSTWDLSKLAKKEQESAIEQIATEIQSSLDLSQGPLMKVAFFNLGTHKASRLLVVVHHLAVEAVVSFRILMQDLQIAYQQCSRGEAICLPPKTTSFQQWSRQLMKYARSPELRQELAYWLAEPRRVSRLPVDYPEGANTEVSTRIVTRSLAQAETRTLLQEIPATYHTQISEVLLTSLVETICQWTRTQSVLIDLDSHGREEIFENVDISRTVGWFTSLFPVQFERRVGNRVDALLSIKEQIHRIPKRGIGYGLLRYCCSDREVALKLRSLPQAEIFFNYLGQFDRILPESSTFRFAREAYGPIYSLHGNRTHLLQVLGKVFEGQLQISWFYSENIYQRTTVEWLADRLIETLRLTLADCESSMEKASSLQNLPGQIESGM
jgi:non-ribosomal peptide synthase protein (TIGR01720 family)